MQLPVYPLRLLVCTVLLVLSVTGYSQKEKLKKVKEQELAMKVYAKDSSAPAVYLNKYRETYLDYDGGRDIWLFVNEITERIKILNKDGLGYATKKIRSFKRDNSKERVESIRGTTYNLDLGKLVKQELAKDAVFEQELDENYEETAFTMPDARVGSIVEWSYKTISPFFKIDDLIFQEDIPVKNYYARVQTPGMFTFRRVKKGYFDITPQEEIKKRAMRIEDSGGTGTGSWINISFQEVVAVFEKQDIPALKDEPFVDNPRNYRMSVVYELISTEFNPGNKRDYATTWEDVAKTIFKHPDFGDQIDRVSFLKDAADAIMAKHNSLDARVGAALNFVKSKMTWNQEYRLYVEEDLRRAYKEGSGNSSEINLMLVALLRLCDIEANPVLISTKQHGIPLFPTREGFNYVIAGVRKNQETILLDATEKLSAPNILPIRVYNWDGRMINKIGVSQEIDLMETINPISNSFLQGQLHEDGSLSGSFKQRLTSLEALSLRLNHGKTEESKWAEYEQNRYGLSQLTDYSLEGLEALDQPVVRSFNFIQDKAVDRIGSKMFLSPMSFLKFPDNPFKSDERQFPISFDYPYSKDVILNIALPEGYVVSSLPEAVNLALPDDSGSFLYSVAENNGMLQVLMRFKLKKHVIPVEFYPALKEFFKQRMDKENEKVILEKSL